MSAQFFLVTVPAGLPASIITPSNSPAGLPVPKLPIPRNASTGTSDPGDPTEQAGLVQFLEKNYSRVQHVPHDKRVFVDELRSEVWAASLGVECSQHDLTTAVKAAFGFDFTPVTYYGNSNNRKGYYCGIIKRAVEPVESSLSRDSEGYLAVPVSESMLETSHSRIICSVSNCTKFAGSDGLCFTHHMLHGQRWKAVDADPKLLADPNRRKRKMCCYKGCSSDARKHDLCGRHYREAEMENEKRRKEQRRCCHPECSNIAKTKKDRLCGKHYRAKKQTLCPVENCTKRARIRGLCSDHGPACSVDGCTAGARTRDLCAIHASTVNGMRNGKKVCCYEGCLKLARSTRSGRCKTHRSSAFKSNPSLKVIPSDTKIADDGDCQHTRHVDAPKFTCDDPEVLQTIIDCSMPATDGEESDSDNSFTYEEAVIGEDTGDFSEEMAPARLCRIGTEPPACLVEVEAPVKLPTKSSDMERTDSFTRRGHVESERNPGQNELPAFDCESGSAHRENVMEVMNADLNSGIICRLPSSDPVSAGDTVSEIMFNCSEELPAMLSLDCAHTVAPESVVKAVAETVPAVFPECASPDPVLADRDGVGCESGGGQKPDGVVTLESGQLVTSAEEVHSPVLQTDTEMVAAETTSIGDSPDSPVDAVQFDSDTEFGAGDFASVEGDDEKDTTTPHSASENVVHKELFACKNCDEKFAASTGLERHKAEVHPLLTAMSVEDDSGADVQCMESTRSLCYRCEECRKTFSTKALLDLHVLQHNAECEQVAERVCPECGYVAADFGDLTEHVSQHALRPEDKVPCLICGLCISNNSSEIERHMKMHHPELMQTVRILLNSPVSCAHCPLKFASKLQVQTHVQKAHPLVCAVCGLTASDQNELSLHVALHEAEKLIPCTECGRSYPSHSKLKFHCRQSHTGEYQCERCQKVCHTAHRLALHLKGCSGGIYRLHSTVKNFVDFPYRCDECQRGFRIRKSFLKHMSIKHPGKIDHHLKPVGRRKKSDSTSVNSITSPEIGNKIDSIRPASPKVKELFPERRRRKRLRAIKPNVKEPHVDAPKKSVRLMVASTSVNAISPPDIGIKIDSIRPASPKFMEESEDCEILIDQQTIIDCSMPVTDDEEFDSDDSFTYEEDAIGEDLGNVSEEMASSSSCSISTEPTACLLEIKAPMTSQTKDSFSQRDCVESERNPGQNGLPVFDCESGSAHRENVVKVVNADVDSGFVCGLPPSSAPASAGDIVSEREITHVGSEELPAILSLYCAQTVVETMAPESVDIIIDENVSAVFPECTSPDLLLADGDIVGFESGDLEKPDGMFALVSGYPVTSAKEAHTPVLQTDTEMVATETASVGHSPDSPFDAVQFYSDTEFGDGGFAKMEGDDSKDTMTLHSASENGVHKELFACKKCDQKFGTSTGLKRHNTEMHPRITAMPVRVDFEAAIQHMKSAGSLHYRCKVCRKNFYTKALLDMHVLQHTSEWEQRAERICPECAYVATDFGDLMEHVSQHALWPEDKVSCSICGLCVYNNFSQIKRHIKMHQPKLMKSLPVLRNDSLACTQCPLKFSCELKMQKHVGKAHTLKCVVCEYMASDQSELKVHFAVHEVDNLFSCTKCGRSYPSYFKLKLHCQQSHTGEYQCERCQKVCHTPHRLALHLKTCSGGNFRLHSTVKNFADFPYRCDECQRGFRMRKSFLKHMTIKHPGRTDHRIKSGPRRKKSECLIVDSIPVPEGGIKTDSIQPESPKFKEESEDDVTIIPEPRRSKRLSAIKPIKKEPRCDSPSDVNTDGKEQKRHRLLRTNKFIDTKRTKTFSAVTKETKKEELCTTPAKPAETGNRFESVRELSPEVGVYIEIIRPAAPTLETPMEAIEKDVQHSPFTSLRGAESSNSSTGYNPVGGNTDAVSQAVQTIEMNEEDNRVQHRKQGCPICKKKQEDLVEHLREFHPDYPCDPVECELCGQTFANEQSLQRHKYSHKQGIIAVDCAAVIEYINATNCYQYICQKCRKIFRTKTLLDLHILEHDKKRRDTDVRNCPSCEFVGTKFTDLIQHVSLHALGPTDKKPCLLCGCLFSSTADNYRIKTHMLRAHPAEMRAVADRRPRKIHCPECSERFSADHDLRAHMLKGHGRPQCLYCKVLMITKCDLDRHVTEHMVNNVFPCNFCPESFDTYDLFDAHFDAGHRGKISRTCMICKRVCKTALKLQRHMKRCLEGKLPVKPKGQEKFQAKFTTMDQRLPCKLCDSVLASYDSLKCHMRWRHGGEKEKVMKERAEKRLLGTLKKVVPLRQIKAFEEFPFGCVECQMGYMFKVGLLKHNQAKHPEKDLKIE